MSPERRRERIVEINQMLIDRQRGRPATAGTVATDRDRQRPCDSEPHGEDAGVAATHDAKPRSSRVGTNTGHGHVWARPDGVRARCGGPALCSECARDAAHLRTADGAPWSPGEGARRAATEIAASASADVDRTIPTPDEVRRVLAYLIASV